jgi:hydroxymethylbilane synthase
MRIRIATRKSELALWQAAHAADRLRCLPGVSVVELVPLTTRGDRILDRELSAIGGKGLFIKELEMAIRDGTADIAVHSMKDVPAEMPDGFCIGALLRRGNPFDALVSTGDAAIADLPRGAVVGSSSLRRQAQLKALRPDVDVQPLRGNVNTRLAKLDRGDYDAIVLACAGLERLGLDRRIGEQISPERMLPATAQGVIGIECAAARHDLKNVLALLNHAATEATTVAERSVAAYLDASCHSPLASYAVIEEYVVTLTALVASVDGRTLLRQQVSGPAADAATLGSRVGKKLMELGADKLLHEAGA